MIINVGHPRSECEGRQSSAGLLLQMQSLPLLLIRQQITICYQTAIKNETAAFYFNGQRCVYLFMRTGNCLLVVQSTYYYYPIGGFCNFDLR